MTVIGVYFLAASPGQILVRVVSFDQPIGIKNHFSPHGKKSIELSIILIQNFITNGFKHVPYFLNFEKEKKKNFCSFLLINIFKILEQID